VTAGRPALNPSFEKLESRIVIGFYKPDPLGGPVMKRGFQILGVVVLLSALVLAGCGVVGGSSVDDTTVFFESNVGAEFTGYTISFRYPRELEVGYFSDSGAYGWLIADADPQEVFWASNQTGNELLFLMMVQENVMTSSETDQFLERLSEGSPPDALFRDYEEGDRTVSYFVSAEQSRGLIISPEVIFSVFGQYPAEKSALAQRVVETLLETVAFPAADDRDYSQETSLGSRTEGLLEKGTARDGYLAVASEGSWEIVQEDKGLLTIHIDTGAVGSSLFLEVLDRNGAPVFPASGVPFSGGQDSQTVSLPEKGAYTLRLVLAPENQWYGWYRIEIE
jgi:hypothetical protein